MEKVKNHYWGLYGSFIGFERHFLSEGYTKVYTATTLGNIGEDIELLVEYQLELGAVNGNSNISHLCYEKINLIRISGYDDYYHGAYFLIKTI